jgi:hypothetical protein
MKKLILIMVIGAIGAFLYYQNRELNISNLETTAVSVVDQIMEKSYPAPEGVEVLECHKVKIIEKLDRITYSAIAVFDDGRSVNIEIRDLDDTISVQFKEIFFSPY